MWCPECRKNEIVIDIQPLPARKEAEEFLNRNRRKSIYNNQMNNSAAINE
jgi:hypothetical protein